MSAVIVSSVALSVYGTIIRPSGIECAMLGEERL